MDTPILLTGATGFVGGSVLRALMSGGPERVSVLARHPEFLGRPDRLRIVRGDLGDRSAVRRALAGVETVVHAASYVGYDPILCRRVNQDGTALLVEEGLRAGVTRFIYVSTTGVFGRGPHSGGAPTAGGSDMSPLSQSRWKAESHILAGGGISVRPALVVGQGDKWALPAIRDLSYRIGALVEEGVSRVSMVHARHLGHVLAQLARMEHLERAPRTLVAANPEPVSLVNVTRLLVAHGLLPAGPHRSVTREEALVAAGLDRSEQLRAVAEDYWFNASDVWKWSGLEPPRSLHLLPKDVASYRKLFSS